MIGKTLAHYQVTALLGKGGMGEVYRALDTKLNREVAIKLLPTEFSGDPERLARFEREATTLASLQHTNIATIYGFEQDQGRRFLVMELVEGEELAERLLRGPIPVEEAIDIALQITEGLEAAHARGIVHRDLKPANIKITAARDAKILDFGLARAYSADPASGSDVELAESPTITAGMTRAGVILGTAAYMSPEQARGRPVDKQTDIWSFGVVLYEMLSGGRLFGGETVSDSIGAILHRDPDFTELPSVPSGIRTLLRRCLERDKRQRLRDIGDARLELLEARSSKSIAENSAPAPPSRSGWWVALALAVIAAALGWIALTKSPARSISRLTLALPKEEAILHSWRGAWSNIDLSPDGKSVVYVGGDDDQIYLRPLESFESTRMANTPTVTKPRFSPDGRWIAYTTADKIFKLAVSGGAPVEICDAGSGPGIAWGNGEIYFARGNGGGLWAVSADGGEPRQISQLNVEREETSHRWPRVLPGGRHLLLTVKTAQISSFDDALIGLLSLDSGEVEILLPGGGQPRYVNTGHLLYGRDSQLFAIPFDLESMTVEGTPTPVLEDVFTSAVNGATQFALSNAGDLAYVPSLRSSWDFELIQISLSGQITSLPAERSNLENLTLSPDGSKLAGSLVRANDEIWTHDIARRTAARLSTTPGNDTLPVWSSDGTQIAYCNDQSGSLDLYLMAADGSSPARRLLASPHTDIPNSWTRDGSTLLFTRYSTGGNRDLWRVGVQGDSTGSAVLASQHRESDAQLSPNERWLAYVSNVSGTREVYLRTYPGLGNPIRVSTSGGRRPRWSPDSARLYFADDRGVMAVPVNSTTTSQIEEPEIVFEIDETLIGPFAVMPNGDGFIGTRYNPETGRQRDIRLIFDWTDRLKQIAPVR